MNRVDKDEVRIHWKRFSFFCFCLLLQLSCDWGLHFSFRFVCRARRMDPRRRLRRHLCITARMGRAEVLFTVDRPVWLATELPDHLTLNTNITTIIQQRRRRLTVTACRRPRPLIPLKVSTYTHNFTLSSDAAMMIENTTGKRCHVVRWTLRAHKVR